MAFSLETGDLFTAEISYVSKSGIGSVQYDGETISIGPVTCGKGTTVYLRYLGEEPDEEMSAKLALCLIDDVIAKNYDEYIERLIGGLLIGKEPPDVGVVTYARIDQIKHGDLAVCSYEETDIWLGPVTADVGDLVKIEGLTSDVARVLSSEYWGENYDTRIRILANQTDDLPVTVGREYTTGVRFIEDNEAVCSVQDVPVRVPSDSVFNGQKIDIEIVGFNRDYAVGSIVQTYDKTIRVENAGKWARLQWLEADFGSDPLIGFTAEFLGAEREQLPDAENRVQTALIAEAIRYAVQAYSEQDEGGYPRAHISGIRHWVSHKLGPLLGELDDGRSWFRETLDDGVGPTLEFLGDVMKLKGGYYAPGKTRAIQSPGGDAILISGEPTLKFIEQGFDIQFRGLTRIIPDSDSHELEAAGIPCQSQAGYLDVDDAQPFDSEYLIEFIASLDEQPFQPADDWETYKGRTGYRIEWGDDQFTATLDSGQRVSLWRAPIEFGRDEYWLRRESVDGDTVKGLRVPNQYVKQVVLALDAINGLPRQVDVSQVDDRAIVNTEFSPPSAQMRWLAAIGAEFIEPRQNRLRWQFDASHIDSVKSAFDHLAVTVNDTTNHNEIN